MVIWMKKVRKWIDDKKKKEEEEVNHLVKGTLHEWRIRRSQKGTRIPLYTCWLWFPLSFNLFETREKRDKGREERGLFQPKWRERVREIWKVLTSTQHNPPIYLDPTSLSNAIFYTNVAIVWSNLLL